jgi:autotransporter-associated beta strand protein
LFATHGRAQNWTGAGSTPYSWNDTANWSGGIVPNSSAAVATFSNAANVSAFTVNLPSDVLLQTIAFNANQTGTVSIGSTGGTVTLSTNGGQNAFVVDAGSGDHTINVNVLVAGSNNAASRLWQVNGTATLSANGVIAETLGKPRAVGKTGTGTLILTGANTFSNGFNLSGGSAYINNTTGSGTGSGPVSVAAGTKLGGTGTIAGTVTVAGTAGNTGKLAPGDVNAPGTLTVNNNISLGANTEFVVRLNGATDGTYDRLNSTGNITLTGSSLTASVGGGYTPTFGDKLFVIVNSGAGTTTGTFNGLAEGATVTIGLNAFTIHYGANFEGGGQPLTGGNDVALTPVPEPATVLGVAAAGALAVGLRRRFRA